MEFESSAIPFFRRVKLAILVGYVIVSPYRTMLNH